MSPVKVHIIVCRMDDNDAPVIPHLSLSIYLRSFLFDSRRGTAYCEMAPIGADPRA